MNIYFIFPYRGVGGVSLLFMRFAEYISALRLANCFLVDYIDGYMSSNIQATNVEVLYYSDNGDYVHIPSGSIIVFQSMTPWSIFPKLNIDVDVKVLFWNCYPFNLIPLFPGIRRQMQNSIVLSRWIFNTLLIFHYKKVKKFISMLVEAKALVFMDKTNVKATEEYLGLNFNAVKYVPVALKAADFPRIENSEKRNLKEKFRVVWVGRVVDFKFYSLCHALSSLNKLQPELKRKVEVTIIGCGPLEYELKRVVSDLTHLEFNFIEHVNPSDLDGFLLDNTDLLLAMGTSALEGARLAIPTILLDVSYEKVSRDYVFTWIYQRDGYTLGELIDSSKLEPNNFSLENLISDLIESYQEISKKTLDHFIKYHEINGAVTALLSSLNETTCTYGQLKKAGILDQGFFYSIFSKMKKMS